MGLFFVISRYEVFKIFQEQQVSNFIPFIMLTCLCYNLVKVTKKSRFIVTNLTSFSERVCKWLFMVY